MLPHAVYHDAAEKGCLLAAFDRDVPIGYTLFRLPRNEVVLTHVCVDPAFRGWKIARLLVEKVSSLHHSRQGIKAKCRDDYPGIERIWYGLGFCPRAKAQGRGIDKADMTIWWRNHGHPDLFTPPDEEPTVVRIAVDTNILLDLQAPASTPRRKRSEMLRAQHLDARIELIVSPALERDIQHRGIESGDQLVKFAKTFRRPNRSAKRASELFDMMLANVQIRRPDFPRTDQDTADLWQLAEAAACGAQALLTWDECLLKDIAPIALSAAASELARMRVLDPDHLEIRLDELANRLAYSPSSLHGSQFTTAHAGSDARQLLQPLRDSDNGETKANFNTLLRAVAQKIATYRIVRAPDATVVAAYGTIAQDQALDVPLFRVADHPTAETLTRQLLWMLRQQALTSGASVVRLTDEYMSPTTRRIAETESYRKSGTVMYALVIDTIGTAREVTHVVNNSLALHRLQTTTLVRPHETATTAAQYERLWWPAKITDSDLPHFMVSITPRWSADLFGVPETLTPRDSQLALGRQHVYYRSGRRSCLRAPGRILWYLSQDKNVREGLIIGTSLLDDIQRGTPEDLHREYSHFGVFGLHDIRRAGGGDLAEALLLSDMELFRNPIPRSTYDSIRTHHTGPRVPLAPTNISSELFEALYRHGRPSR